MEHNKQNYKLVVHENFLATTYLETISYNFPTVILFREIDSFYLRNEFKKDIKPLIKAKIVHKNFKSLKKFLDENLSKIDEWWNDDKNQKIIKSFIKKYTNTDNNKFFIIRKICSKY